jgi:hypothetical protein
MIEIATTSSGGLIGMRKRVDYDAHEKIVLQIIRDSPMRSLKMAFKMLIREPLLALRLANGMII